MSEKRIVSYVEYEKLLNNLVDQLKNEDIDLIYAEPKGGLPIGVHLSHYLSKEEDIELPIITSKRDLHHFIEFHSTEREIKPKNILVVDDLVDTGITIKKLIKNIKQLDMNVKTAVIFYKTCSPIIPEYYAEKVDEHIWIYFPWEKTNEVPNREGY